MGLMLVSLAPELDSTNSLLMKRPVGRANFLPLGAVRETSSRAMVGDVEKGRGRAAEEKQGGWEDREGVVVEEGPEGLDKHHGEDGRRRDRRSGVEARPAREARKWQCRAMCGWVGWRSRNMPFGDSSRCKPPNQRQRCRSPRGSSNVGWDALQSTW